ncbi:MAG: S24/S26 family peptidase [Candidatus Omnitrophota bacterium]
MGLIGEVLKSNFAIRIKVRGSSMLPFIRTGDYVTIIPVSLEDARIGDIIAYGDKERKNIICHRLIKRVNSDLVLKGDTHLWSSEKVSAESLLGKVVSVECGKSKFNLEDKPHRFLSCVLARVSRYFPPLLFLIAYYIEAVRGIRALGQNLKQV